MTIEELMALAAEQPTRTSRRAGVSRSTIKRIVDGQSMPTINTLKEIALALGLEIDVYARHASDPFAAAAARSLIDDSVPEHPQDYNTWIWLERFERWGINDPLTLVSEAGTLLGIKHNYDADYLNVHTESARRLPEIFDSMGCDWAMSGAGSASVTLGTAINGPTILWYDSAVKVDEALFGTIAPSAEKADLILVPARSTELVGKTQQKGLNFVAPVQLVIDLHSIGMHEVADFLTRGWRS